MTIPILGEIERLINEHGSSVILKERLALASHEVSLIQQQKSVAENQSISLKGEITNMQEKNLILLRENEALRLDLSQAEEKIRNLEKKLADIKHSNPSGYTCDNCGSKNLKHIGNKPNKTFGVVGIKDSIFLCNDCEKESAFIQNK